VDVEMSAPGPVPDELLRLLAVIEEWLKARGVSTSEPAVAVRDLLARTTNPEVAKHLADAGGSLVAAFRAFVESPEAATEGDQKADAADPPSTPIQHIAVN
jgi:hypothetical protein